MCGSQRRLESDGAYGEKLDHFFESRGFGIGHFRQSVARALRHQDNLRERLAFAKDVPLPLPRRSERQSLACMVLPIRRAMGHSSPEP